jgi:hypothetical protein
MTKQEEERIFNGPFPWKKPGFAVVASGVAVWHAPPKDKDSMLRSGTLSERVREVEKAYFGGLHDMKDEMQGFSRLDLHAEMQMTREDLGSQWVELQKLGGQVQASYVEFREWIAERFRIGSEEGAIYLPERSHRSNARDVPFLETRWDRLLKASHVGLGGLRSLKRSVTRFNGLSGRYAALRERRRSEVP